MIVKLILAAQWLATFFCFIVVPELCSLPGLLPNHSGSSQEPLFFLCVLHLISTWVIVQSLRLPLIQVIKGLTRVTTMTMMQGSFKANKLLYQKYDHQKCSRWRNAPKKAHWSENSVSMGMTCMDKRFQKIKKYFFFFNEESFFSHFLCLFLFMMKSSSFSWR